MGYSISWIAFKGKTADEAMQLFSLARTGQFEEIPESMFSGTALDTGWYLTVINEHGHPLTQEKSLQRVSSSCEVIVALVEEHVMASSAECWKDGTKVWAVAHEFESGAEHLKEQGALPDIYRGIKDRLLAAQKTGGADYIFEIPLELAKALVGFKHDDVNEAQFEVLSEAPKPSSGGLFSRLFGKK